MRKVFLSILFSVLLCSCNKGANTTIENLWDNFSFNNTKSNSTEIIIKLYDTTAIKSRSRDLDSLIPIKEFKVVNENQIESFDEIFINAEKTSYCCCPNAVYSVQFLNKKKHLGLFCIDTLEFKDKIRLYEASFQYSYLIDKSKWKKFLDVLDQKANQ
ncbi:hypothetical protein ASE21_20210 [Flavobacterium sp. Root901]|uniref:hypothetical protein n=1 Tax=Flavobacterium sp. Root901 TaxID=1736605 RepID=UPI0007103630|nr:hypothetical protein [Flavobacterium sp. Root901]KRD06482.1 hypothetical protein ASE21_20210 [Flavobacterium sp. Root901]